MKRLALLLTFCCVPCCLLGQTTVTGTIVDPNGNSYANGTASAYTVATSGQPTTSTSPVATNSAGLFTLALNANTYVFTICAPPVGLGPTQNPTPTQVCFTSSPIVISGPSQDVSTQLNALAKVIGPNRNITGNAVAPVSRASIQAGATSDVQLSNAITALSGGSGIIWADYSTNQTWAACPTWGSGSVHVKLYPITYTVAVNCTIPANVTLQFSQGTCLSPATGTITTMNAAVLAGNTKIFCNALSGQGAIDFTGGTLNEKIYPEWWGASPAASAATNTPAIQAAIYGAFGGGATASRTNNSGLTKYNRHLQLLGNYQINGELQAYHVINFIISGVGRLSSGLIQTATNQRIIDGQSVAYGSFEQMSFSTTVSQDATHPLIDIDYSGAQGTDLKTQNITFRDDFFSCNGVAAVGVQLSKSGGGAQGDNVRFLYNYASGCTQAAAQLGTSSSSAQNTINVIWEGGDIQGCPQYALYANGGNWIIHGTSFENGVATQTGFDVYCTGAASVSCAIDHVRSESRRLAAGGSINAGLRINDSKTIFQALQWNTSSLAGTTGNLGDLISGDGTGGDGHYYKVTVAGTWGGLNQTNATSGSANSVTNSGASYTVNGFAGQRLAIYGGSASGYYCVIASNTATTITCNGSGFLTNYSLQYLNGFGITPVPDNTSQFAVEPNWGTQTTSGTVTFADLGENAIEGPSGGSAPDLVIENSTIMGGSIYATNARIKNLLVSRADWLKFSGDFDSNVVASEIDNVRIVTPDDLNTYARTWTLPRNNLSAAGAYTGMSQYQMGTRPIVWSSGQRGGGSSARDVWIGGRTDTYGGPNDVSRAVLEFGGILGRATSIGTTNSNGTDTDIQGGLPTGSGTPGNINFWTGNAGSSGTSITDGTKRWQITGAGHLFAFADNTYDIGAVAANRPRNLYIAGVATLGSGSTKLIQTNTASNSDLAGELSFSAATTSNSYSFTGTYTSHPECTITPQFSPGASHVIWISTLSTSALQLSSDTAQTGAVSYICIGRN